MARPCQVPCSQLRVGAFAGGSRFLHAIIQQACSSEEWYGTQHSSGCRQIRQLTAECSCNIVVCLWVIAVLAPSSIWSPVWLAGGPFEGMRPQVFGDFPEVRTPLFNSRWLIVPNPLKPAALPDEVDALLQQ